MPTLLEKVLKTGDKKVLKQLRGYADAVNLLDDEFKELSDEELRGETERFKERIAEGETLDSLLPEAFAAVREAADRTLGQRHYDVQIMGGLRCIWAISPKWAPVRARLWWLQRRHI